MENFEEHLMEKFPNLFPKDKDGKTTYSDCGIGGLEEWEPIIEAACRYIDSYCRTAYRLKKTKKPWPRIKYFFYQRVGRKIYNRLYFLLDPYRKIIPLEIRKKKSYVIQPEWKEKAEKTKRYKWQKKLLRFYFSLSPDDSWEKVYPPPVTLCQLKTKFNECRWYIDGGDGHVYGIVSFTEHLCDQITAKKSKIEKPDEATRPN